MELFEFGLVVEFDVVETQFRVHVLGARQLELVDFLFKLGANQLSLVFDEFEFVLMLFDQGVEFG